MFNAKGAFCFFGADMGFGEFLSLSVRSLPAALSLVATLCVVFVNGWTDAPNAIASCVSTGCLDMKKAVMLASVANFAGAFLMRKIGAGVSETVINMADFGNNPATALAALCAGMCAVVIWASAAWAFGIPTSESHALLAGLAGASVALSGGFSGIDTTRIFKVFAGLVFSSVFGFFSGFVTSKLTAAAFSGTRRDKSEKFFRLSQIFSSAVMAFMHGAQDSQKFAGVLTLQIFMLGEGEAGEWVFPVCAVIMSLGTALGGGRIIKTVGVDMVKMETYQGFAADAAGGLCLFLSTLFGFPVSTTHTKTTAVMGVGAAKSLRSVDWSVAGDMAAAWIFTFPGCGILGWLISCIYLKVF